MRGLTIQNREFYEWKQKNLGWAPSRDPTTTILAPWLLATPCSTYEKKKRRKSLSLPELEPFQKFTMGAIHKMAPSGSAGALLHTGPCWMYGWLCAAEKNSPFGELLFAPFA